MRESIDLLRTLGGWLAVQGYSRPLIGRALNHSNLSTTQIYAGLDLGPVRAALEKTAGLMLDKSGSGHNPDTVNRSKRADRHNQ
jgi:hypothetical protein